MSREASSRSKLRTEVAGPDTTLRPGALRAAIDKLPEHYRSALVLCEYEQMPYAEIAKTLNASVPQIKTWIHRARRQLALIPLRVPLVCLRGLCLCGRLSLRGTASEKHGAPRCARRDE